MKAKLIFAVALLVLVFASAGATSSKPKPRIQLIYQGDTDGTWVLHLYGNDKQLVCEDLLHIRIIEPSDPTHEPLEIKCSK